MGILARGSAHPSFGRLELRKVIVADRGVRLGGHYSQAIVSGGFVFVSGQGPFDPETNTIVADTFENQVLQTLENLRVILEVAGSSLDDVVKINAYLSDLSRFEQYNAAYREVSPDDPHRHERRSKPDWGICL